MVTVSRKQYADLFGPTVGDRVRLADTNLIVEVEKDYATYGDEVVYGGGKTVREGMGMSPGATHEAGAIDHLITNALILDPVLGIIKADIGFKDGVVAGVGKAGNPGIMDNVDMDLVVSSATDVTSGEGAIITPGFFDTHVHMICPQQIYESLANGITTYIGGGTGPSSGTCGTTQTSGPWNIRKMMESVEGLPANWLFLGKGNDSKPEPLVEQLEAGAGGFKIHEDFGFTAGAFDCCMSVADQYDVQVAIHTDTLNEGMYLEDTIDVLNGRTVHTYHSEGAGGGHAPDLMAITAQPNVLPSSTNPTNPFTVNSLEETFDMIMVTHHLNPKVPEDVAFCESRIRGETMAAEDVLHDMGVISMYSSDSQAMGRCGEVTARAFQNAHKMKSIFGKLPEDADGNDNYRVKRYLAKLCINPAITNGIADYVGSLEKGKIADAVIWEPAFFGAKPKMVWKSGFIAYSMMGDPNASIPTPEPVTWRPMFGGYSLAQKRTSATFVSKIAYELNVQEQYGLERMVLPVQKTRNLGKVHMMYNDKVGDMNIDPETYKVTWNGDLVTCQGAKELPLAQRYYLF